MLPRKQPEQPEKKEEDKENSQSSASSNQVILILDVLGSRRILFPSPSLTFLPTSNENTSLGSVPLHEHVSVEYILRGPLIYQDDVHIRHVTHNRKRGLIFMTFDDDRLVIFDFNFKEIKCFKGIVPVLTNSGVVVQETISFDNLQVVGDDLYITTTDKQLLKINTGKLLNSPIFEKILSIDELILNLTVFKNQLGLNLESGIYLLSETVLNSFIQKDEGGFLSSMVQIPSEEKIVVTENADGGTNRLRIYRNTEASSVLNTTEFKTVGKRGENGFREPSDLVVDEDNGLFYVADMNNNRIVILDLHSDEVKNVIDLGKRRPNSLELIQIEVGRSLLMVKTETDPEDDDDDYLTELLFISISRKYSK